MTNPPPPSFMCYLIHTLHDGTHGGIAWPVHSLAVVGGTPRGAVDVNLVRLMAHGVGFDEVRHVGLIQHAYACGAAEQSAECINRNGGNYKSIFIVVYRLSPQHAWPVYGNRKSATPRDLSSTHFRFSLDISLGQPKVS